MPKMTHKQLKSRALQRLNVKKEYDSLNEEFSLYEKMIKARLKAGKTQEDIAKALNCRLDVKFVATNQNSNTSCSS